jgi:pSer/pThr/pTyr-binding forkhead associated (FHA) protein
MHNNLSTNNAYLFETEKMSFPPRHVRFVVEESNETLEVVVNRPIIIGRSDHNSPVDVDLTHKGGYRLGISRQHLALVPAGAAIVATDLDSRNGSKLNGEPMMPMQRYVIHSGDTLQLSGLNLHIHAIN